MSDICIECKIEMKYNKGYIVCPNCGYCIENVNLKDYTRASYERAMCNIHNPRDLKKPIGTLDNKPIYSLYDWISMCKKPDLIKEVDWNQIFGIIIQMEKIHNAKYTILTLNQILIYSISKYFTYSKKLPSYQMSNKFWCKIFNIITPPTTTKLNKWFYLDKFVECYKTYFV